MRAVLSTLLALACLPLALAALGAVPAGGARIKDIARLQGTRQHALVGYGLVTGLAGTGDSPGSRATRQTLANLLAAIREGDFSIRGRPADRQDALGAAMAEVNALGATLRCQRLGALEASALLDKVMAEIEVAVFTFDEDHELKFVNRAGARLRAQPAERLLGRQATELDLLDCLTGEAPRVHSFSARSAP